MVFGAARLSDVKRIDRPGRRLVDRLGDAASVAGAQTPRLPEDGTARRATPTVQVGTSVRAAAPNRTCMQDFSEAGDAQLVTSIGRYSEVALAEVYRRHGGAVFGLARRVLANAAEAEDVTQEV